MFGGRNSYSKTDPDATFMRMKEDHMLNGQLKPGYNVQVGTENGFVLSYALFSNPTDTRTLLPHLHRFERYYGKLPKRLIADKGYGSYENYGELEGLGIEAYIKYPHWEQEKKVRSKKYRYRSWRFHYDKTSDVLICPEGATLSYVRTRRRKTYNGDGYVSFREYRATACPECRMRNACTTTAYRTVQLNLDRLRLYKKARDRLRTDQGWQLYRKRGVETETVFGQIKGNQGFRRFATWGKENVACEWAIHMIGYNIKNLSRRILS